MKKKLIFCLCIALSMIICFSSVPFSAYTYDCDVEITSSAVLLVNTDTGSVVYDKNSNTARYSSYLCNIMTYIVARTNIADTNERITIKKEVLDKVKNSDGSLTKYINHTLTINDLFHFLLMTNGVDAAYVLADHVSKGNIDNFVSLMNKKALSLGCTKTKFSSPGVMFDATQVTTCADMYKILLCAIETPDYIEISSNKSYMPEKYQNPTLKFTTNFSLVNDKSPYYFKYTQSGKFAYDKVARGNVVAHAMYKDVTYICVILGASNENEHNAFTEAKQLFTWSYTTLGNEDIIYADDVIETVPISTSWGSAQINLTTGKDITRTMPEGFSSANLTYEFVPNDEIKAPVFQGQNLGVAKIYYEDEFFEEVDLISDTSYGVGIVDDMANFIGTMFSNSFIDSDLDSDNMVDVTVPSQTETVKATSAKQPKSTQAGTTSNTTAATQAATQAVQ